MSENTSRTAWFTQSRFGMFIHWGLYALPARHEWVKSKEQIPEETYQKYFDHFDPDLYDPRDWARRAREAGMKYVVLTTKHHEGFCLWDSAHTDYKATNTPYGKDLLKPFVEAFRAEGLRVGFYYSLIDWHHPQFPIDRLHPRKPKGDAAKDPEAYKALNQDRDMTIYADYMRKQVRELLTDFGEISLLWFDFTYGDEWENNEQWAGAGPGKWAEHWESHKMIELVKELQPNCLINPRLGIRDGSFTPDFMTPEQQQPEDPFTDDAGNPIPWEACQTFSGSWGYYRDEHTWKSLKMLLWMLIDGVSKGGNLLLNVGPTARGEFDYRACDRLDGLGTWMHHHQRSIYGCSAAPAEFPTPPDCRYTWNPETNRLYLHFFNWPLKAITLKGLGGGKVKYLQLLNDASEIFMEEPAQKEGASPDLKIHLPIQPPPVEVPVVEIFLK